MRGQGIRMEFQRRSTQPNCSIYGSSRMPCKVMLERMLIQSPLDLDSIGTSHQFHDSSHLQCQIILDLRLCQLSKRRRQPLSALCHQLIRRRRARDDSNLDGLFADLTFEAFFEGEECRVDCVFQGDVVVVSKNPRGMVSHSVQGFWAESGNALTAFPGRSWRLPCFYR
jgi:hypothetical protein